MKRKREEHNGCGGGTPGSQKTRRTAPPDAYFVRIRGVVRWLKLFQPPEMLNKYKYFEKLQKFLGFYA